MIFGNDRKKPAELRSSTEKDHVLIKASNYLLNAIYVTTCKKAVETFHIKLLRITV